LITTSLLVGQLWNAVHSERSREEAAWQTIRYIDTRDQVTRLVGRATTDAEEYVMQGNPVAKDDFAETSKKLSQALANLSHLVGSTSSRAFAIPCVQVEQFQKRAIDLQTSRRSSLAKTLLSGADYMDAKEQLTVALSDMGSISNVQNLRENLIVQSETRWAEIGAASGLFTSILMLVGLMHASRKWGNAINETSLDRQRAETELLGTKARFDRVVANLPGMAYECVLDENNELRFTYVSDGCRELFGLEPAQVVADPQSIFSQILTEDVPRLKRAFEEAGARRMARWIQIRTIGADGEMMWLNCAARPNISPDDNIRWDGIFLDDTPRQRAEQDLRQSRNFLDSVIENLPDMVFIKEARDLRFVLLNRAGEDLTGFSRAEIIGKNDYDFFPPDQAEFFSERDRAVLSGRDSVTIEREPISTKNRGTRILYTKKIPLFDQDGNAKFMLGISEDVTDRIRTEQALAESEQRLKAILDHATMPVTLQDTDGRVVLINEQALRVFGLSAGQVIGRDVHEFLPPNTAALFADSDETVLGTRKPVEFEVQFSALDGRRTMLVTRFPLFDLDGNIYAIGTFATDFTDRQRAAEEVSRAKEEAEHANMAKSVFLSRMSHELRTPLNAILGFAQLLEMELEDTDQAEMIQFIMNAGRHLLGLINEVLDISRIDSGNFSMSLEPVSVNEIVHEVTSMVKPMADAMKVALRVDTLEPDRYLLSDRRRLAQSLLNLASNAIKYNRQDGEVTIGWIESTDGCGTLQVRDTGPGIPEDRIDRLFVAFDRLGAESSSIEGTGLGLSLSQRLVEKMGGVLRLADTGDRGSTFEIRLPLASAEDAASAA
jgi:PAS domain S-box-containing protein